MGVIDSLMDLLQKPQGVFVGGATGLGNQIKNATGFNPNRSLLQMVGLQDEPEEGDVDELNTMFSALDKAGVDTSEWQHLRPRAQSFLSGVKEGWNNDVSPSRLINQNRPVGQWEETPGIANKILGTTMDIAVDPLMAVGASGAVGRAASKVPAAAKFVEGSRTIGNLGEGATALGKAGQLSRRGLQGVLGSAAIGGDPLTALGLSGLIGGAEKLGVGLAPKIGAKVGASSLSEAITNRLRGARSGRESSNFARLSSGADEGQLFNTDRFNVSNAAATDAGASSTPRGFEDVPLGHSSEAILQQLPQTRALPPAFGSSGGFPMPADTSQRSVYSSGVLDDFLGETLDLSSGVPRKMSEQELLQMLRQITRG